MSLKVDIRHHLGAFRLNVSFHAPEGVTVLFGRSGSGKTSVVRAVAGLLRPDEGRIEVNGEALFDSVARVNVPVHQRGLGYVFQESRLFPHLSVRDNLTYARRVQGQRGEGALTRVVDLLGLGALMTRRPAGLSGGEAQRVAIGRALLSEPRLLLMDEPLAALDAARRDDILPYLERLRIEGGLPILYVSHNMSEVARLARHLVVLEEGRIARAGPAEVLLSDPSMVRLLGVREAGAVLAARITAQASDGVTELEISGGRLFLPALEAPIGARLRVRILAQDVILATDRPQGLSALNILQAQVAEVRRGDGPGVIVQLRCGTDTLLARVTRRSADAMALETGKPVWAVLKSVAVAPADVAQGLAAADGAVLSRSDTE